MATVFSMQLPHLFYYRREAIFRNGCVAKGRRFASVKRANSRGPSQEGVWVRIAVAPLDTSLRYTRVRRKLHPRGNRRQPVPPPEYA